MCAENDNRDRSSHLPRRSRVTAVLHLRLPCRIGQVPSNLRQREPYRKESPGSYLVIHGVRSLSAHHGMYLVTREMDPCTVDTANKRSSSESCSVLPNTQKVLQAQFQTMRHISTVWTHCRCLSPWCSSISCTLGRSWLVKRAIFLAGKKGRI